MTVRKLLVLGSDGRPQQLQAGDAVDNFNFSGSLLYANTTIPAGNTTTSTSETALSSTYTIPANLLVAGDVLRFRLRGTYGATTVPSLRIKIKAGSTILIDTGAVTGLINGSNQGWSVQGDIVVTAIGSSGTFESQGTATFQVQAFNTAMVSIVNTAAITVNTTIDEAITVTVQWGAGGNTPTMTMREMIIERLPATSAMGTNSAIAYLGADVALNNVNNYFDGPSVGPLGTSGETWLITAFCGLYDSTAGGSNFNIRIWDGTTVYSETPVSNASNALVSNGAISALVTLTGATTFKLSAKATTSANGILRTSTGTGTANKATAIIAVRVR